MLRQYLYPSWNIYPCFHLLHTSFLGCFRFAGISWLFQFCLTSCLLGWTVPEDVVSCPWTTNDFLGSLFPLGSKCSWALEPQLSLLLTWENAPLPLSCLSQKLLPRGIVSGNISSTQNGNDSHILEVNSLWICALSQKMSPMSEFCLQCVF